MAITVNKIPKDGYKYIPQAERDTEKPFAVWVRPIATRDLLDLEDRMVKREGDDVYVSQGVYAFRVAQQGILAWENIVDADGKDIKFVSTNNVADENTIANIPVDIITEVSGVISAITHDPSSIQVFFPED